MRNTLLFLSILFILLPLAGTDVSGTQQGTWSLQNSPYNVVGDINVPAGETLTIEAGVQVLVPGNFRITVQGQLSAIGSPGDSIRFESTQADPSALWKGIRLENESTPSFFINSYIEKAENGVNSINSPVQIMNSRFYKNQKGIHLYAIGAANPANVNISNNVIEHSIQNGIMVVQNSNALISENEIRYNGTGSQYYAAIQLSNQSTGGSNSPIIQRNHIHHNFKQGITAWDIVGANAIHPHILENTIEHNLTGIYLLNASGYVADNIIRHNFIAGDSNSGAGVMVAGATSEPYFERNQIHGNFTGFYLGNNAQPCLGNLNIYHAWAQGENHIYDNIDESNTPHSVFTYSYTNPGIIISAENNWWGTDDSAEIAIGIHDQNDDPALPVVDFEPILTLTEPAIVQGSFAYYGAYNLQNLRFQLVGQDSGEILFEAAIGDGPDFSFEVDVAGSCYAVILADTQVPGITVYGTRGSFATPTVFNLTPPEDLNIGLIGIVDTPPPRHERIGAPQMMGSKLCFPVENYLFVYDWDQRNWLYEEGDFLYLKRHERIYEDETYSFDLPDGTPWDKIRNFQYSTWQRTEIIDIVGTQRISEFQLDEFHQFFVPENFLFLLTQRDLADNSVISQHLKIEGSGWYRFCYDGNYVSRVENYATRLNSLQEGDGYHYAGQAPNFDVNNFMLQVDLNAIPIRFHWQAPMNDGTTNWTNYRIYQGEVLFAELPFSQTTLEVDQSDWSWYGNTFQVRLWNGTQESPGSNLVTFIIPENSDELAVPPALHLAPNPVSLSSGKALELTLIGGKKLRGKLGIYNLRGQLIKQVPVDNSNGFTWTWDLRDDAGKFCASGIYFVRVELEGERPLLKKAALIK
ncbi:MAG: hypothetical protein GXY81_03950 [Candidatus Cloacimonetes bacterium]|nr:hypothetical protein [Candidatus Cloacimonadota bacterium]